MFRWACTWQDRLCASFALLSFVDVPFVMQRQMPKFLRFIAFERNHFSFEHYQPVVKDELQSP